MKISFPLQEQVIITVWTVGIILAFVLSPIGESELSSGFDWYDDHNGDDAIFFLFCSITHSMSIMLIDNNSCVQQWLTYPYDLIENYYYLHNHLLMNWWNYHHSISIKVK